MCQKINDTPYIILGYYTVITPLFYGPCPYR